jgi:hypothetical protein
VSRERSKKYGKNRVPRGLFTGRLVIEENTKKFTTKEHEGEEKPPSFVLI